MKSIIFFILLLAVSGAISSEPIFDGEDVVDVFENQNFKINLSKAKNGNVRAQYLVGIAYLYGLEKEGVSPDQSKSLFWLKRAADQGAAEANSALATIYRDGLGVDRNITKFEAYLAKAGNGGLRSAKLRLLDIYDSGVPALGIEADEERYLYWLRATAEDGVVESMQNLARRYRLGLGVEKNLEKAFEWVKRAVKLDDAIVQAYAAEFYEKGIGTEVDMVTAYMLYDLSSGAGREAKDKIARKMTDEQIQEAIARSWQWQVERNSYRPSSDGYRYRYLPENSN